MSAEGGHGAGEARQKQEVTEKDHKCHTETAFHPPTLNRKHERRRLCGLPKSHFLLQMFNIRFTWCFTF